MENSLDACCFILCIFPCPCTSSLLAASIFLFSLSERRQNVSRFASIICGKGEPSLSIHRKGRSWISLRVVRSCLLSGSVASLVSLSIVLLRMASDMRLGMQPKGPIAITPQAFDAISARLPPTVNTASPVNLLDI